MTGVPEAPHHLPGYAPSLPTRQPCRSRLSVADQSSSSDSRGSSSALTRQSLPPAVLLYHKEVRGFILSEDLAFSQLGNGPRGPLRGRAFIRLNPTATRLRHLMDYYTWLCLIDREDKRCEGRSDRTMTAGPRALIEAVARRGAPEENAGIKSKSLFGVRTHKAA